MPEFPAGGLSYCGPLAACVCYCESRALAMVAAGPGREPPAQRAARLARVRLRGLGPWTLGPRLGGRRALVRSPRLALVLAGPGVGLGRGPPWPRSRWPAPRRVHGRPTPM